MRAAWRRWLTLAIAIAATAFTTHPVSAQPISVDLELVLAVDVSGSVDAEEADLQRQGYVDAIADPEIIRAIQSGILGRIAVTYFEWAGDGWQIPVLGWTVIDSAAAARDFAKKLSDAALGSGPWTSISQAIDFGASLIRTNNFEGTRRIIDVSGDGPNNTGGLVVPARDAANARRITVNGLPIINDRLNFGRQPMANLDLYYRNCVIGGPGAFMVVAHGFKSFAKAIRRKLILEIAGTAPPARPMVAGHVQAAGNPVPQRWVPPCNEGERRFRGIIDDE